MAEQPVWDEFLERMEETFKEYLENLDIGYVIQNFLERFNLEEYFIREQPHLYGSKFYTIKKLMKEQMEAILQEKDCKKCKNFEGCWILIKFREVKERIIRLDNRMSREENEHAKDCPYFNKELVGPTEYEAKFKVWLS